MAKMRRTRGTGSYDKVTDAKGSTVYRWRIGIYNPIEKKTAYKSIKAKSREVLEAKVEEWKKENSENGILPPLPQRLTVEQWVEIWFQTIENRLAYGTIYHYKFTIKRHLLPGFGKQWISQVSPLDLQRYFDGLLKILSPVTVATIRAHMSMCFEAAVRLGVISKNPVKQTLHVKIRKPDLKILEESEVERLLAVAKSGEYFRPPRDESAVFNLKRNYLVVLLAVATGMRQGEIFGLTWPCVDVVASKIEVKHSLQDLPNARVLKAPKNGKSRIITIPDHVADELKEWREFQANYAAQFKGFYENPVNLVFTKSKGGYISAANFSEWDFRAMLVAAGLSGTRFHDLRHFFASSMLARGASIMAVSEHLGHSSIDITLRRYTHVLERSRDEMKEMLNANPLFGAREVVGEEMAKDG